MKSTLILPRRSDFVTDLNSFIGRLVSSAIRRCGSGRWQYLLLALASATVLGLQFRSLL